jgi:hypothetical protein
MKTQEEIQEFIDSQPYYGICTHEYKEGIEVGINWIQDQDSWISVKDRLPENHELVNIILNSGAITVGRISSKFTHWICFTIKGVLNLQVTHWQPLPNPPNK